MEWEYVHSFFPPKLDKNIDTPLRVRRVHIQIPASLVNLA